MLNYIWMSLLAIGILTAVGHDAYDEIQNSNRNGVAGELDFEMRNALEGSQSLREGDFIIRAEQFNRWYGSGSAGEDAKQPVTLRLDSAGVGTFLLSVTDATPGRWREMAKAAATRDKLSGTVVSSRLAADRKSMRVTVMLEPIHFMKLKAITQAALDFANTAVEISLGLIGIMALWLGLMKIAEEAGLVLLLTKILAPVTKRIFPDVPADHPAVGAMIMNIAANMLGLNNAATPLGLKAMEELDKLSPKKGTATNAMVTFLTINTGGLILIPATAIAVRAAAGSANPGIIIGTSIFGAGCATVGGVIAAKLLQRLPRYRKELE